MAKLEIFVGALLTFMLPCQNEVTIREQTAEDDDILGRMLDGDMIDALNEFVSSIVVSSTFKTSLPDGRMTIKDVLNIPLKDKHYILVKSRLHSMGPKLKFEYTCQNPKCKALHEYEEDLSIYDQDLAIETSTSVPEEKDKRCIVRYPMMKDNESYKNPFEKTLASGKKIRMTYMNGTSEKLILAANKNKALTTNTEYFVRNLQVQVDGEWQGVSAMNIFSKREVIELNQLVTEFDRQYTPLTEVVCPDCGQSEEIPVMAVRDFFFPTEI